MTENPNINKSSQFLYDKHPPGVRKLFSKILAPQCGRTLTQCLLRLTLVGVFEDEEVVSGGISGDPVLKLLSLCGFGVHQLNGLFLDVQPLQHKSHTVNFTNKQVVNKNLPLAYSDIIVTIIYFFNLFFFTRNFVHQLDVVDASLLELLQSSFGLFL